MKFYSLSFNTKAGSRRSFRINNPDTDVSLAVIAEAVADIIKFDVFDRGDGGIESLNRMELTVVERTVVI